MINVVEKNFQCFVFFRLSITFLSFVWRGLKTGEALLSPHLFPHSEMKENNNK
jgi:hypothetical protein